MNHRRYLAGSRYLGPARVHGYTLLVYGVPFAVEAPMCSVRGELYYVSASALKRIDELEGHPDWYRRVPVRAVTDSGDTVTAWMYILPGHRAPRCYNDTYICPDK